MTQERTGGDIIAEAYAKFDKWEAEFKEAAENSNLGTDVDGLGLTMLIFIYNRECLAVEVALEEAQAGQARARDAALLEACKAVCVDCDSGETPFIRELNFWKHWHTSGRQCRASRIREHMTQEKTALATDGQEGLKSE